MPALHRLVRRALDHDADRDHPADAGTLRKVPPVANTVGLVSPPLRRLGHLRALRVRVTPIMSCAPVRQRAGLEEVLSHLRPGDSLVVWKLVRLGRTVKRLVDLVAELEGSGVQFRSLTDDGRSVSAIANEVGVSRTYLRYWFPDLCKSLSLQNRKVALRKLENRRKQRQRSVRKAIRRLAESGGQISYRRVAKLLAFENLSLSGEHLRNAYRDEINAMSK